jgi:hypothetical protein
MLSSRDFRHRLKSRHLRPNRNWKAPVVLAVFIVFLLSGYLFVYHSHYYGSSIASLSMLGFLAGPLVFHLLWIDPLIRHKFSQFLLTGVAITISLGLFILLKAAQDQVLAQHRTQDGVSGYARVVDFEVEQRKGPQLQYVVFEYQQNQKVYRQRIINSDNLHLGDSLRLRYSASDPENVEVNGFHRMGTSYGIPLHGQYEEIR